MVDLSRLPVTVILKAALTEGLKRYPLFQGFCPIDYSISHSREKSEIRVLGFRILPIFGEIEGECLLEEQNADCDIFTGLISEDFPIAAVEEIVVGTNFSRVVPNTVDIRHRVFGLMDVDGFMHYNPQIIENRKLWVSLVRG